jgi:hypothetical protein
MRRALDLLVVVVAVATLAVWTAALLMSMPRPPPKIVVQGEPLVSPGNPLALRITAAREGAVTRSRVEGEVVSGSSHATVIDGAARLDHVDGPVRVELRVDDEDVRGTLRVEPASLRLGPPKMLFFKWHSEVQTAVAKGTRFPVYPLDGHVSARLPSRVLTLEDAGPRVFDVEPRVQGAQLDDGRVLGVDRTGLRITAPLEVEADHDVEVQVEAAEARDVSLDVIVDGAVQDVVGAHLDGLGKPAAVKLHVGAAQPDDAVVFHVGGVWPDDTGRWAVARVRAPDAGTPPATWVDELLTRNGAPDDEPLLNWIRAHPDADETVLRAALGRLKPVKLRAPRLELVPDKESPLAPRLRLAFGVLALLLVVATAILGMVRVPERRGAVVLGVLVVAAILGGLGAALFVVGRGP